MKWYICLSTFSATFVCFNSIYVVIIKKRSFKSIEWSLSQENFIIPMKLLPPSLPKCNMTIQFKLFISHKKEVILHYYLYYDYKTDFLKWRQFCQVCGRRWLNMKHLASFEFTTANWGLLEDLFKHPLLPMFVFMHFGCNEDIRQDEQ